MKNATSTKSILAFLLMVCLSVSAKAQQPKWVLGNSQANSSGTFYTLGINNLKFYEINFGGTISSTQRTTGNSINNILSVGTQDVIQSAVDTAGNIAFYAFGATTVPFQSSGPTNPDTIYFAAYNAGTSADEVFGKVPTEGWGASVIESELVKKPGSIDQYYFIYKTKSVSTSLDNIRYVTINATTKTVSTPTTIVANEKTGEGMAVSQLDCQAGQRWLFTSKPETSGDITLKRCSITSSGISVASDVYTISIPGNSITVIAAVEIAPTNNMLAIANYSSAAVSKDVILLDFNNASGALSNERYYTNAAANPIVTMEFSPNASRIYFMQGGSSSFPNVIYSCAVSATNHTITSGEQLTGLTLSNSLTLEVAYDGKLYINPSQNANFLYVIANPNSATPTVSSTVTNLFGTNQRVGSGFPDQVDGDLLYNHPCGFTSISESTLNKTALNAYPNPSTGNFTIDIEGSSSIITFRLFDVTGKIVRDDKIKVTENKVNIQSEQLEPGIYIFNCFENEKMIGAGKIIIE